MLVCHDGEPWLPQTLAALRAVTPRPRYVLAVDTGSTDETPVLLSAALGDGVLDGVLTMPAGTAFGAAVEHAVSHAEQRWGDPGRWLWLLHDDSAPEPTCLAAMVRTAAVSPSVAMLGPLCLDWSDPRLVIEAGLSTDASGHRQTGLGTDELDPSLLGGGLEQSTEVLAVGSAGALVRRDVWHQLDGYDPALPLLRDDLDFGWRVNRADHLVLIVPSARIRHAAAGGRDERALDALDSVPRRAADRAHGVRTFLANCSTVSYLLGLPRLVTLCLLRALAFAVARHNAAARAELHAVGYLVGGRAGLRAARRSRRASAYRGGSVRGLLTSRWSRLRAAVRGGLLALMRRRMVADAAIGRLPVESTSRLAPAAAPPHAIVPVGPDALPAGALGPRRRGVVAGVAGMRRPGISVVVPAVVPPAALGSSLFRRARPELATSAALGATSGTSARYQPSGRPAVPDPPAARPATLDPATLDLATLDPATLDSATLDPATLDPATLDRAAAGTPAVEPAAGTRGPNQRVGVPDAGGTDVMEPAARPSPVPRRGAQRQPAPELIVVDVGRARLVRELLLAPSVLLVAGLVLVAAVAHRGRYGLDLTGGRLAPSGGLAQTWSAYLAEWHPVLGGTASPSPATLAVLGVIGGLVRPFGGGPGAAVSLLLLGAIPLAGLSAYFATRRMPVPRRGRALAAAAYALLPVGTAAAVDGRLDGVVAHVLLPAVLAGVAGVLTGWSVGGGTRGWLPSACATALGLAVISAFAPLVHLLVLALVLVGFVAVPGQRGQGLRRVVALFLVVLLPLGLLLPWPAVVVQHPSVLLHGAGVVVAQRQPDPLRLLMLDAGGGIHGGGHGIASLLGVLVVGCCLGAVALRPRRAAVPGLAVAAVGMIAAMVVGSLAAAPLPGGLARPGWPGAALLLAACGLLWAALSTGAGPGAAAARAESSSQLRTSRWAIQVLATAVIAALAGSVVLIGAGGSLVTRRPRLAPPIQAEVSADRTGVLVLGAAGEPVRAAVGRLPAAGDDDLAPVATAATRMARWAAAFRSGQQSTAQAAVLEAAVSGFEFVVLPDRAGADGLLQAAGTLVAGAPDTDDGRPTVRLLPMPMPVVVLAPQVADRARTGGAPPADYGRQGVVGVPAAPPAVGAVTEGGANGRALVVAAEMEDGWLATVDGRRAQVARAWGHLVAVPLPADAAQVRLERSSTVRGLLLLVQLAVALFTAVTAIPPGDRR